MSDRDGFDDLFDEIWSNGIFRENLGEQGKIHRSLMDRIKALQEAVKNGKLQGDSELIPIERPGTRGFIFRGRFGSPGALEKKETPEMSGASRENKESFTVPPSGDQGSRAPIVETMVNAKEFIALVELPGLEEEDIKVEPGDSSVEVSALNFETTTIDVPENADLSKMSKKYKNGVLEIRTPLVGQVKRNNNTRFGVV